VKILYITQLYHPLLYGGGEYIFTKWAEEMARRGHIVLVITQKITGTNSYEKINGVNVYRVKPEIKYAGALYNISLYQNIGFLFNAAKKAKKLASYVDLIHSNTFTPTIAAEIAARISKRPHLATIHDVYLQTDKAFWGKWSSQRGISYIAKSAGYFVEKVVLKLPVKMVHTVSNTSRDDLIKAGISPNKISVISNGIYTDEYQSNKHKKKLQVAYIGRLVFYKNLDTVIKAFKKVCQRLPQARLIIAGKGPYEKNLKQLTLQLGLQENVIFAGKINDQEKVDLLTESQLMVQPSLVEGFGITIIEAFYCNTPVLASNVMPLPEIVKDGDNGNTLSPFDVDAWATAIIDYLEDPQKCLQRGASGHRLVEEKYTISKVVDRLIDLYNEKLVR